MIFRGLWWVWLSFILALMLTILPLPAWAAWSRPEWLLLAVIYWALALPNRVSVGVAWVLGLLMDAINGSLLGEHALAFLMVVYITVKLHLRIRVFPLWQQAMMIATLVFCYQLIIFCIQGFAGKFPQTPIYWLPSLTSMLLWPWVFIVLRDWRRRFRIR
jgi:rod shape-determining protein MreD